jgi:hypothetical protein
VHPRLTEFGLGKPPSGTNRGDFGFAGGLDVLGRITDGNGLWSFELKLLGHDFKDVRSRLRALDIFRRAISLMGDFCRDTFLVGQ